MSHHPSHLALAVRASTAKHYPMPDGLMAMQAHASPGDTPNSMPRGCCCTATSPPTTKPSNHKPSNLKPSSHKLCSHHQPATSPPNPKLCHHHNHHHPPSRSWSTSVVPVIWLMPSAPLPSLRWVAVTLTFRYPVLVGPDPTCGRGGTRGGRSQREEGQPAGRPVGVGPGPC